MDIGSRRFHWVDEATLAIHPDVVLHPVGEAFRAAVVPLVPLLGLVHLRIPLLLLVLGGAWCGDQGGIDDRALLHCHAIGFIVGFDHLKDLLAHIMLLQQVPECQNRGLIRDPVADHVDPSKTAHRRHLDQRILHRWITEVVRAA